MVSSLEDLVLQAREQFETLLALVEGAGNERIDRVEGKVFVELLGLGLTLLRQFVAQHGTGDVGSTLATGTGTWKRLEDLLRYEDNVEIVGRTDNGLATIAAVRELEPDIVFLDIQTRRREGGFRKGGLPPVCRVYRFVY